MTPWHDRSPIYRQLADRLTSSLLDGDPPEGDAMPSVRVLAQRFLINPITVGRALQALSDDGLLEMSSHCVFMPPSFAGFAPPHFWRVFGSIRNPAYEPRAESGT